MPKLDVPPPPSFSVPSSSSAPKAVSDEFTEPQEVRDERAAAKNEAYKQADADAKAAEKAAKVARDNANEAKKAFKQAKGEACKTRPGGKLLCIRGFGAGY
jgi:flagellar biosynthesis/type III secretory pathway protein FliH